MYFFGTVSSLASRRSLGLSTLTLAWTPPRFGRRRIWLVVVAVPVALLFLLAREQKDVPYRLVVSFRRRRSRVHARRQICLVDARRHVLGLLRQVRQESLERPGRMHLVVELWLVLL